MLSIYYGTFLYISTHISTFFYVKQKGLLLNLD